MTKAQMIRIFRAATAPLLSETNDEHEMTYVPPSPPQQAGADRLMDAGVTDGFVVKSLYSAPGFSLSYVWFKPNFPLARHSHDADCLYYVISGEARLGAERLGPGDGFFVPKDSPYTYHIGEAGVEVLEFRHTAFFNVRTMEHSTAYWEKAAKAIGENRAAWLAMTPPRPAVRSATAPP